MCVECKYTCIEICCGCTAYLGGKRFFANAAFEGAFLRVAAVVDLKCRLARERLQADLARGIAANACAPHTDKRGTVEDGENGGKKKEQTKRNSVSEWVGDMCGRAQTFVFDRESSDFVL